LETRIVFHIDFDYFYAQCEEIRLPELKSKPVCVCVYSDRGGDSGAIATANYTARRYGVKSGIPIIFAKKRLEERKDAVFLPVDFDYYFEMSEKAMKIMESDADIFEYVGKDEAYLDVTKRVEGDYKKASHLAQQIKNSIRDQVKLSCSIGISPNKLISKIASNFQKPDGLTIVSPEKINEFLEPLEIRVIPGIGKKTENKFSEMNLKTIQVFWPSAGVHSIIIFSLVIGAFMLKLNIPRNRKAMYFVLGIIGTIIVNLIRIFSLSWYALKVTTDPTAWEEFHQIAGEIMFLPWLFGFILVVILIESRRLKKLESKD